MRCSVRGGRKVHPDAGDRSLPARMRALEDILAHLLGEIERAHASARSAEALAEQNERSLLAVAKAQAVLRGEPQAAATAGARHAGKAKRDRHGMHVVRVALIAAGTGAGMAWQWAVRSRAHKAVTGALAATVIGGATVAAPSLILGPPPPAPAAVVPAPHHHYRPSASPVPSQTVPALAAPARSRHHHGTSTAATSRAAPAPSASAAASPPAPVPSATATGIPTVLPSVPPTETPDPETDSTGGGGHGHGLLATVLDAFPLW